MSTDIKIDVSRAMADAVGEEHGITKAELKEIEPRIAEAHAILRKERADGIYGFWSLHDDKKTLADVEETASELLKKGFENLVILGIGGSALGTTALVTALRSKFYNLLSRRARGNHPRIFVVDNIDPDTFKKVMKLCPPQKTLYNVISKSGNTAETMSQLMIAVEAIEKKFGKGGVKDHVVVTSNPRGQGASKSLLHPVADEYGLKSFDMPLNVGGRFSVFSTVGLFPAAMLGMDLDAMFEGCAAMDARCAKADLRENPAYLRAAIQYLADTRKGKVMSVMMPYSDALRDVADWYCQLWAESLGKRTSLNGEEVFTGQTPIKALGATDQHSQIQLYREGPNNKIINVLEVGRFDSSLKIPDTLKSLTDLNYLRGKTMNKLMAAELQGTVDALKLSKRPVSRITLPRVNEHTVAQLLYMLEAETAMAGRLYNVNTFDQPGVEEGKTIARELMGGKG
ncbi:MAG TPA: glucose-6-phosphate isomerase [Candidatus Hydrogenedentes bacterium]|nr:glucose-6-phosphate isomerase [Candidatus Hydrogenedentota bacterium]